MHFSHLFFFSLFQLNTVSVLLKPQKAKLFERFGPRELEIPQPEQSGTMRRTGLGIHPPTRLSQDDAR